MRGGGWRFGLRWGSQESRRDVLTVRTTAPTHPQSPPPQPCKETDIIEGALEKIYLFFPETFQEFSSSNAISKTRTLARFSSVNFGHTNSSQIHSPFLGDKSTMAWGCRTGPPAYVAWRGGTTTLCHCYPPPPPPVRATNWALRWEDNY